MTCVLRAFIGTRCSASLTLMFSILDAHLYVRHVSFRQFKCDGPLYFRFCLVILFFLSNFIPVKRKGTTVARWVNPRSHSEGNLRLPSLVCCIDTFFHYICSART